MRFREERFLFELPYDARIQPRFVHHAKDGGAGPREEDWQDFDLKNWLGLDSEPAAGSMCSTTLMFSAAERSKDPLYFVSEAWPSFFAFSRRSHPRWKRWTYSRPARWLRGLFLRQDLKERKTVVQAIRIAPAPKEPSADWRFDQLGLALEQLNRFLLACATVHGDPELTEIAIQDLPPVVFGMGWEIPNDGSTQVEPQFWTYLVHERSPDRRRAPLTREEADYATWISATSDNLLIPSSHLFLSAEGALHRGRRTHAVVDSGTAVEMLVSAAIRLVGPARGYDQSKTDRALRAPFKSRLADHFAPLLGYSSDLQGSDDSLGAWWHGGYRIRNQVVHEGHRPSESEALEALVSALDLQHDFITRMKADPELRTKLPGVPADIAERATAARESAGELD